MSDLRSQQRRKRVSAPSALIVAPVLLLIAAGIVVGAYITIDRTRSGMESDRCREDVPNLRRGPGRQSSLLVLLVDPDSNTDEGQAVVDALAAHVDTGLREGAQIIVALDPGVGANIVTSPCLDALHHFDLQRYRDNPDTYDAQLARTQQAALAHIRKEVRYLRIQKAGTPLRLLRHARDILSTRTGESTKIRTVLWSDFLSSAQDCFDIGKGVATERTAIAVVERCERAGSLVLLPGTFSIIGVGAGRRPELVDWAEIVAEKTCRMVSKECLL